MAAFNRDDWLLAVGILVLGMLIGWWLGSRNKTQTVIALQPSNRSARYTMGYDQNPNSIKFVLIEEATKNYLSTPEYVAKKQFATDEPITPTSEKSAAPLWEWIEVPNQRVGDIALGMIASGGMCWSMGLNNSIVVRPCNGAIELWQDPRTLNVIKSSSGSCVRLVNGKLEKFECTLPFPIQIQSV